ncbi:MAG: hypothetical protein SGI77_22515 [Pirellulaceae bacterium]|nr:hypothetical protein [Pirellulaceae bacterium]
MSYAIWNALIATRWFSASNAGRSIILAADDRFFESLLPEDEGCGLELSGKSPVEHFVASVRENGRWFQRRISSNELPTSACYIALAVLAASRMDSNDPSVAHRGSLSYWQPFRELYGLSKDGRSDRMIPKELADIWANLWTDIEHWANVLQRGKFGFVRFPKLTSEGFDAHKNIRLPKSQSLLRLDDLRRLTSWFRELKLVPQDQVSFDWFKRQVTGVQPHDTFFSTNAKRVISDPMRSDQAVNQITSYFSQWNGLVWELGASSFKLNRLLRLLFTIQIAKGRLGVGVQSYQDGRWKLSHRLDGFPIARTGGGSELLRLPASSFIATWDNDTRAFLQTKSVGCDERFLLFIKPPSYLGSTTSRLEFVRESERSLQSIASDIRVLQPASSAPGAHNWIAMQKLSGGWFAILGVTNNTITDQMIPSRFHGLFAPELVKITAIGGAKITRRYWMVGAGPSLRIAGPVVSGVIHCRSTCKTVSHSTIAFTNGVACPSSSSRWPLDQVGKHEMWVERHEQSTLVVHTKSSVMADPPTSPPGWSVNTIGWRAEEHAKSQLVYVYGAEVNGLTSFVEISSHVSLAREWLDTAINVCTGTTMSDKRSPHGLIAKQMNQTSPSNTSSMK